MDIVKLFKACRSGDIETVNRLIYCFLSRFLIQTKDIDINFRDRFDSTPLYFACLCGHTDLVQNVM
ncbi:ankyrin repeat and BTB/POZ domain-containing protein 1-like protein [Sarcoptes scabiei]|uniref:Ankyrin repeat and BTB/POZ domain-containing protein 1-like protein n=1 Tax=Sarcoptes scabiei TaxID=52283 RepID=A0A132AF92_SARSC|nr:ankyrin repeat and BTB/POZ domain-containing protein 1-like protein [Sarcoptes scabiei]